MSPRMRFSLLFSALTIARVLSESGMGWLHGGEDDIRRLLALYGTQVPENVHPSMA